MARIQRSLVKITVKAFTVLQIYRDIWGILTQSERRQFLLLLGMTLCMALFEIAGVALIMPLLSLINDPSLAQTDPLISAFANLTGSEDPRQVTLTFGMTVLILLLSGMVVRGAGTYAQTRFCIMRAYGLSLRLLELILSQPYVWFLQRNTAEFGQSLLSEIDQVVRRTFLPAVLLISNVTVVALISLTLFLANPYVALGAAGLLTALYLGLYAGLRGQLDEMGRARVQHNRARFQTVSEIGQSLKEIKVMGLEDFSITRFDKPALGMAQSQSTAAILTRLPRFAIEAAIYGGFVGIVLLMIVFSERDLSQLVPLFGLIGVASMKLFPALQQIYGNLAYIKFSNAAFQDLCQTARTLKLRTNQDDGGRLEVKKGIRIDHVSFKYPDADGPALQTLSLDIQAGSSVGFVGGTGAGKTTLIDILLGLLHPDQGDVKVDGVPINGKTLAAWQRCVGYVPQSIFLSDTSIAANIAFGAEQIDMDRVVRAAKIAQIHDFVMDTLPSGYDTQAGERGSSLSGGQRQRIGLARALYNTPEVLILDEATSALDNITERAVIDAIHALDGVTVIMIAHRLTTLRDCDQIMILEQGTIAECGTYSHLMTNSARFRHMAQPQSATS
ncbi:ABC-type bacteriocin/lantibiotic exporter, contains an N-terminal double-glycine peptidase domain [Donghicola eburneus]|nr:ABC-type bacteriocin/lantibiotic exporter, contains an N-terminal double-glycine peptidase domain [Donghicola eburneus]